MWFSECCKWICSRTLSLIASLSRTTLHASLEYRGATHCSKKFRRDHFHFGLTKNQIFSSHRNSSRNTWIIKTRDSTYVNVPIDKAAIPRPTYPSDSVTF